MGARCRNPVSEPPLLTGLDSLGDDERTHAVRYLDASSDDRLSALVAGHVREQAPIELDLANGERPQACERGEPGPEVVDREAHSHPVESLHDVPGAPLVCDQRALGDLQHEAPERNLVPGRGELDLVRKARVEHVECTQVDRRDRIARAPTPSSPRPSRD